MLSKAKIKFVKSLQIKKYRKQEQLFVVEGAKSISELLLADYDVVTIVGTVPFLETLMLPAYIEVIKCSRSDLEGLGTFQSNEAALAIARMKPNIPLTLAVDEFALILDDIRDPGNLGTIIRTAAWYGIDKIIASEETADLYNSKVITATMGAFTQVSVYYTDLAQYLRNQQERVFGAYLDGLDIHKANFGRGGYILLGNESHGISQALGDFVTDKITIPRYGKGESLNAAIAAAVICDNIRRSG